MKYKTTKEELEKIVEESLSIADICRALNIKPIGGNYRTIKSKLIKWNLNTSHFTGAAWNVGDRFKPFCKKALLSEILIENSTFLNNGHLKERLIREGLKENKCEICGLTAWLGNKLSVELHHSNGNNSDHRLENLKMLCPNCHSQTSSFRGRNSKSAINELRKIKYNNFKTKKDCLKIKKERKKKTIISICLNCSNINKRNENKFCSYKCVFEYRVMMANMPAKEELLIKFKELKSFVQVGKFYGKSDNAIRKWCIKYNILEEIKKFNRHNNLK